MSGTNFATNPSDEHAKYKAEVAAREAQVFMLTLQVLEKSEADLLTEAGSQLETITVTV